MDECRSRWFTLIELLIVVAIISVLAALLLPALTGAKERAKETLCKGNIGQVAIASFLYSVDGDDHVVPISDGTTDRGTSSVVYYGIAHGIWLDTLHDDYGTTIAVLECPAQESVRTPVGLLYRYTGPGGRREYKPGYGINRYVWSREKNGTRRLNEFLDPSRKVKFVDTGIGIRSGASSPELRRVSDWAPITGRWAALAQVGSSSGLGSSDRHRRDAWYMRTKVAGARFTGGSNHAFFDGHVEFMSFLESFPWRRINANDSTSGFNDGRTLFNRHWDPEGDGQENFNW